MILANARQCLTRDDAQLALRLVARGSAHDYDHAETRLRDEGMDSLLDDPRLLGALLTTPQGAHASLPLFAYVLVRHALRDAGADDRVIADYVTSILLQFGMRDRALRIADGDDEIYRTMSDLLTDVGANDEVGGTGATRAFLVRTHLGCFPTMSNTGAGVAAGQTWTILRTWVVVASRSPRSIGSRRNTVWRRCFSRWPNDSG
jgi:hypothetical protein